MLYIRDIIKKKRNKIQLTEEEIRFFIQGYFKNEISDAQAAALLTNMYINRLSQEEISYMINAVAETGEELECYRISTKLTDIHSLGGMSDKIILMVMAVLDSLECPATKIVGRELGMEDRLISIPKYKLEEDIDKYKQSLKDHNIAILKSIQNLAPVENKLYKLRNHIACDNNIDLVAISIMSQRIALGFHNIFFEITYGKNAYVKTESDAKLLAKYLVEIGKKMMRNVACCVTSFEQPVGTSYGNILEIKEIYDSLSGNIAIDVEEMVEKFANKILIISGVSDNATKNKKAIKEVLTNGKALQSFEKLVKTQGGDLEILKSEKLAKNIIPVISNQTGYIEEVDVNKIRMLGKYLSAIRSKEEDKLDIGARYCNE